MPLKRCTLKGIADLPCFYDALARQLPLPDHFGRNLDALWDALSTDVEGPVELIWEETHQARAALGKDYEKITALFRDLENEREDFRFIER